MKIVKTTSKINEVKEYWLSIDSSNRQTIFQSYDWNSILFKRFSKDRKCRSHKSVVFIVLETNKASTVVAPLMIDELNREISIFGQTFTSDYLDLIYSDVEATDLYDVIELLQETYSKYEFIFDRVNESSELYQTITQKYDYVNFSKKLCAKIVIDKNVNFISELSENARHNYRKSCNRMRKLNMKYNVYIQYGKLNNSITSKLYSNYILRSKNKFELNYFTRLKLQLKESLVKTHLYNNDILSEYLNTHDNSFLSYLEIDGILAAYFVGFSQGRTLYLCRTSMSNQFDYFSPGIICLVDTIVKLGDNFDTVDLTRGDEKYKFQCGAIYHYNYLFRLSRRVII